MTGACVHHIMPHHPHTGGKTRLAAPMMSCKHIRVSRCCTVCMVGAARPPCTTPRMRAASLPVRVQLLQDGRGAVIQPALLQRPGRLDAGPGRQPARACQHLGGYVAVWLGFNLLHWRLDGASDVWRCLNNQIGDAQNGFTTLPCPSAFSCSTCITLCLRLRRSTGWCVFACACAGLLRAQPGSEASCMHYHWFPDSSAHAPAGRRRHRVLLHHAGRLQAGRPQRQHHRRAARALRRHPDRHRAVRPLRSRTLLRTSGAMAVQSSKAPRSQRSWIYVQVVPCLRMLSGWCGSQCSGMLAPACAGWKEWKERPARVAPHPTLSKPETCRPCVI